MLVFASTPAHADTVASLLGNFTINQYSGLALTSDTVTVHHAVVFGQLPALRELHTADTDGDGVTSQSERDAYGAQRAQAWADELDVTVDGKRISLRVTRSTTSLPSEQGGFSLRIDADFEAPLPLDRAATHTLTFANRTYNGRFGWNEIAVTAAPPWKAFDTNAFDTSLTGGLTEALQNLPASGPLQERSVRLRFSDAALPAGAVALGPRDSAAIGIGTISRDGVANPVATALRDGAANPGAAATRDSAANRVATTPRDTAALPVAAASSEPPDTNSVWLQRQTRRLVDLVAQRDPPLAITLLALLAATLLGAVHAFSPGHGKTVVGAYLIGSRATARHAMFLGATVTITHTLGVFALGFATLVAANSVAPERIIPLLSVLSGLLVLGMGIVLLVQRWPRRSGSGSAERATPDARSLALSSAHLRAWTPASPAPHAAAH